MIFKFALSWGGQGGRISLRLLKELYGAQCGAGR